MKATRNSCMCLAGLAGALLSLCAVNIVEGAPKEDSAPNTSSVQAWVGARIIDGTGKPAIENATLVIRNGRIEAVGRGVKIPAGAERIDATGKTIIPGLISAHGHVNDAAQLGVYLRAGVTTVLSLGGEKELGLRGQWASAAPG